MKKKLIGFKKIKIKVKNLSNHILLVPTHLFLSLALFGFLLDIKMIFFNMFKIQSTHIYRFSDIPNSYIEIKIHRYTQIHTYIHTIDTHKHIHRYINT